MEDFGRIGTARAGLVTLSDGADHFARLTDFGARLVQLWVPGRDGQAADIVLGHDSAEGYLSHKTYFGATCGRYANRIAGGRFMLDGKAVQLDVNEGANTLHGGRDGFDSRIWDLVEQTPSSVTFALHSPDGDMGFPGALDAMTTYAFTAPGRLEITMTAKVDGQATVINLVNHAYFNLAGQGAGTIDDQILQIAADRYLPVDGQLLPLAAPLPVTGTAFDFRRARTIGAQVPPGGFDHNLCLNEGTDQPAVTALDPESGRGFRLWTDQPGVQFYTGSYLPQGLAGKAGALLGPRGGFTLETQRYPNSPNHADFPSARLAVGENYRHHMRFDFFTQP
jgi:aldose 1-epimerase